MKNIHGVTSKFKFTTALAVICLSVAGISGPASAQMQNADVNAASIHQNSFMYDAAFSQAIEAGKIGKNRLSDT